MPSPTPPVNCWAVDVADQPSRYGSFAGSGRRIGDPRARPPRAVVRNRERSVLDCPNRCGGEHSVRSAESVQGVFAEDDLRSGQRLRTIGRGVSVVVPHLDPPPCGADREHDRNPSSEPSRCPMPGSLLVYGPPPQYASVRVSGTPCAASMPSSMWVALRAAEIGVAVDGLSDHVLLVVCHVYSPGYRSVDGYTSSPGYGVVMTSAIASRPTTLTSARDATTDTAADTCAARPATAIEAFDAAATTPAEISAGNPATKATALEAMTASPPVAIAGRPGVDHAECRRLGRRSADLRVEPHH